MNAFLGSGIPQKPVLQAFVQFVDFGLQARIKCLFLSLEAWFAYDDSLLTNLINITRQFSDKAEGGTQRKVVEL